MPVGVLAISASDMDPQVPGKPSPPGITRTEAPTLECRTVFYTPPVSASPGRIEREVMALFAAFS
jgi:hypothetical protein